MTEANPLRSFVARQGMNYAAAFAELRERLPVELGRLWSQGFAAHRPVVFFLAARKDGSNWANERDRLVDRQETWYAPHVVVYGLAGGGPTDIQAVDIARMATQSDFAFGTQDGPPRAIPNVFSAVRQSLVSSGRSLANNRIRLVVAKPDGFTEV